MDIEGKAENKIVYRSLGFRFWFGELISLTFVILICFWLILLGLWYFALVGVFLTYFLITKNRIIYINDAIRVLTRTGLKTIDLKKIEKVTYGGFSSANMSHFLYFYVENSKMLFELSTKSEIKKTLSLLTENGLPSEKLDKRTFKEDMLNGE